MPSASSGPADRRRNSSRSSDRGTEGTARAAGELPDDEVDLDATDATLAGDDARSDRGVLGGGGRLAAGRDANEVDLDEDDGLDNSADDDPVDDDSADEDDVRASGGTLTKTRPRTSGAKTSLTKDVAKDATRTKDARKRERRPRDRSRRDQRSGNVFVGIVRFIREVVAEMRKVLWPSRRELGIYTIAVIIFVAVMIAIVGALDYGFARLVLLVFG